MEENFLTNAILPLRGLLILPGMIANVDVGRDKSLATIRAASAEDNKILLVTQKDPNVAEITKEDLYDWGVLAEIKRNCTPNGAIRLLVEGLQRVQLTEVNDVQQERMIVIILSVTAKQY